MEYNGKMVLQAQATHALKLLCIPADIAIRDRSGRLLVGYGDAGKELQKILRLAKYRLAGSNMVEELPMTSNFEGFDQVVTLERQRKEVARVKTVLYP